MIFEAIVDLFFGLVELIASAMGTLSAPGWLTGLSAQLGSLVAMGASMGVWVPWSAIGVAMAAVLACYGVSFVVFLVRMAVSLFTGGGGKA